MGLTGTFVKPKPVSHMQTCAQMHKQDLKALFTDIRFITTYFGLKELTRQFFVDVRRLLSSVPFNDCRHENLS